MQAALQADCHNIAVQTVGTAMQAAMAIVASLQHKDFA